MESEDFSSSRELASLLPLCTLEFQGEEALVTDTTTTADREDMYSNILGVGKAKKNKKESEDISSTRYSTHPCEASACAHKHHSLCSYLHLCALPLANSSNCTVTSAPEASIVASRDFC